MCNDQISLDDLAQKKLPEHLVRSIDSLEILYEEQASLPTNRENHVLAYLSLDRPFARIQVSGKRTIVLLVTLLLVYAGPEAAPKILEIARYIFGGHG